MNWDAVQTEALKQGWLIYAMDQGQTYVTNTQGPWGAAALGYCLGLTVRWIALRYGESEYVYDRKTRVLEAPDWRPRAIRISMKIPPPWEISQRK